MVVDWTNIEARVLDYHSFDDLLAEKTLGVLWEIDRVRSEKNAIILAHYYQIPPIQMVADFKGDSLALAMKAKEIGDKDLVVSSTVHFMAEMVKLLSPDKKVVIPSSDASCSIAEGINASVIQRIREEFPKAAVVGYINTTATVKAEFDSVCTSANAEQVVQRIPGKEVILVPDHLFFRNILKKVDDGRRYLTYEGVVGGSIVLYDHFDDSEFRFPLNGTVAPLLDKGTCIVHEDFTPEHVKEYRRREGVDLVLAHPEVRTDVAELADKVGGTGVMMKFLKDSSAQRVLYLSECDLAVPLVEAYPSKKFVTPCLLCPYMKKNTLDGLLYSLREEVDVVDVDAEVVEGARRSLERMFELTA
tara:strand:+ start:210 stop:1289 length:1080 start_codon:yes stop_codon:yes gene_type:complete